jgi:hypothetical protein
MIALAVVLVIGTAAAIHARKPPHDSLLDLLAGLLLRGLIFIGAIVVAVASAITQAVQTFPHSVKWHYDLYTKTEELPLVYVKNDSNL